MVQKHMGMMNNLMIEASEALQAVEKHTAQLHAEEQLDGWVEEIRSLGDGFLVTYTVLTAAGHDEDGDGPEAHLFAVHDGVVTVVERAEYDLAAASSLDMSDQIPDLMEMINE
jgi:hypothetical protein